MSQETAEIVLHHTEELARTRRWHENIELTQQFHCFRCKSLQTFFRSRWKMGCYVCTQCAYRIQVRQP